ncbi:MAG: response regulator [Prosthecochloris sp.]|nr:response regulator [Prosthecochloris sp.]
MSSVYTSIRSLLNRMLDYLGKDYEQNRITIDLIRYIALWGHPLYYVLCTFIFPQPYESIGLRMGSAVSFVPLLFYKRYPGTFKPWLNLYWYLWLTFTFPFIFTYLMLMNDFSGLWLVAETVMLFVFIIFIPNFLLMMILLTGGIWTAYMVFVTTTGSTLASSTNIVEYFISIPIAILLGLVLSYTNKKGAMAQERNRVLQSLAGSIAHEMRNPLGQVRQCLNSIQKLLPAYHQHTPSITLTGQNINQIYHRLAHGQMAVRRGVQVIDMILGEIRESPVNPESFTYLSAARITTKALDEYGYDSDEERHKVTLEAKETFIFHISETLYIFVIFNLLKNALYYLGSHSGSEITIRLRRGKNANHIYFRDTGPGISREDLPHIFDSFHTRGKKGGTGLGLSYCKRIMNAFGGDITCDSEKGRYTEFTLTFPIVDKQKLHRYNNSVIENARSDFRGKRILVVDDEQIQRTVIKQFLRPLDILLDEAGDGKEALEFTRNNHYDLIIMDLNMPGINGYETAEQIRWADAVRSGAATPIVAYSSEPAYIARPISEKSGMQAFISKPCSQAELINSLRSVLRQGHDMQSYKNLTENARILLVEDSALNRDLMSMVLADAGFHPAIAINGKEAWNMLRNELFDLVITDIHMPEMDGLELTRRIRKHLDPAISKLPVIGLSGSAEEEAAARAAGMNDFKLKTERPDILVNAAHSLLFNTRIGNTEKQETLPVINFEASAEAYDLPVEELKKLFGTFIEDSRKTPEIMRKAYEENDFDRLQAEAHRLKGSVAVFGAETVRRAAEALEHSCRTGTTEKLDHQLTHLIDVYHELVKEGTLSSN